MLILLLLNGEWAQGYLHIAWTWRDLLTEWHLPGGQSSNKHLCLILTQHHGLLCSGPRLTYLVKDEGEFCFLKILILLRGRLFFLFNYNFPNLAHCTSPLHPNLWFGCTEMRRLSPFRPYHSDYETI